MHNFAKTFGKGVGQFLMIIHTICSEYKGSKSSCQSSVFRLTNGTDTRKAS